MQQSHTPAQPSSASPSPQQAGLAALQLEPVAVLEGHTERVWQVAWDAAGETLASASGDKTVRLWRRSGERWGPAGVLAGAHQRTVRAVAFSGGGLLAVGSFDATASVWAPRGGDWDCVATLEGHEHEVKSVAWHPHRPLLATCSRDKSIWLWALDGPATGPDAEWECAGVLQSHTQDVKCVRWAPTGDLLLSASYDDTIRVWAPPDAAAAADDEFECAQVLQAHSSTVWDVAFEPLPESVAGTAPPLLRFASCSDDLSVVVWTQTAGEPPTRFRRAWTCTGVHRRTVFSVAWGGGLLATAAADDAVRLFRPRPGQPDAFDLVAVVEHAHAADINCARFNPRHPNLLATCADDNRVKIWRVSDPQVSK